MCDLGNRHVCIGPRYPLCVDQTHPCTSSSIIRSSNPSILYVCSALRVVEMMADKLKISDLVPHIELTEDVMAKSMYTRLINIALSLSSVIHSPCIISLSLSHCIYGWSVSIYIARSLREDEKALDAKDKWPNTNPTYCKFVLKLKRGSPSDAQMKFREAMYGKS